MRRAVDIVDGLGVDELMLAAIDATRSTYPHPNPRVGVVIVTPDHSVLALGVCHGDGLAHAETNALDALSDISLANGATAIVTLEPCSHHGRTPPCTDALINAGISKVVIGAVDPDPRVSGAGIRRLREAGIEVVTQIASEAVVAADPSYFHHRQFGVPRVTLKMASTIDGQAAALDGTSQWITSAEARADVHRLRSQNDAVVVGAGTVIADDPLLTVRLEGYEGPQPLPVVAAGDRPIPSACKIMERNPLIYGWETRGPVDISDMLKDLGSRGVTSVLVEGGPTLARSFVKAKAVDAVVWYIGAKLAVGTGLPAIAGRFESIIEAVDLTIVDVQTVGADIRIRAVPNFGGG
jgi:diaminohydroxyphosphoribosylaminopyrimidine deaminase/5-amino-6-(5-phosphoribosylamino)uracil reductase